MKKIFATLAVSMMTTVSTFAQYTTLSKPLPLTIV